MDSCPFLDDAFEWLTWLVAQPWLMTATTLVATVLALLMLVRSLA